MRKKAEVFFSHLQDHTYLIAYASVVATIQAIVHFWSG